MFHGIIFHALQTVRGQQVLREHGGFVPVHAVRQVVRRLRRRRAGQLRKVRRRIRQEQGTLGCI